MAKDHIHPEEHKRNSRVRAMSARGCHLCQHAYLEAPKLITHICAHPNMIRRFDVTTFIHRCEVPKRCPLEAV
jgi:hypothetical protein